MKFLLLFLSVLTFASSGSKNLVKENLLESYKEPHKERDEKLVNEIKKDLEKYTSEKDEMKKLLGMTERAMELVLEIKEAQTKEEKPSKETSKKIIELELLIMEIEKMEGSNE